MNIEKLKNITIIVMAVLLASFIFEPYGNKNDEPETPQPDIAEVDLAEPDVAVSAIAETEKVKSEIIEPVLDEADTVNLEITEPVLDEVDAAKPEIVEPGLDEIDTAKSEIIEPILDEVDTAKPGIIESAIDKAETNGSALSEPESTSVEATESKISKPNVTKSNVTHLTVADVCTKTSNKLASVKFHECDIGLQDTGARSVQGIPILMKEYPPIPPRKSLAKVLLIGGIHGDEYSSVSVVYKWLSKLEKHHSGLFHWKIVPLLNPDGLLRKESQRMNANGVDLNRNFPTQDWEQQSQDYWINRTDRNPRRFPGLTPLSEPESRWLHEQIQEFKPDAIVAVHAPYGVLDFDGPPIAPKRLGQLYLNLLGAYPGSLGNYAGIEQNIPVVTIELKHAGIMPSTKEISNIWVDMVSWLKKNTPHTQAKPVPELVTPAPTSNQAGPS